MRSAIRDLKLHRRSPAPLDDIARQLNPLLRGWIAYYGKYAPSALEPLYRHVNRALVTWARRKFKRFGGSRMRVMRFLDKLSKANPDLFVHWRTSTTGGFA